MSKKSKILTALIADARQYASNMPTNLNRADAFARTYFTTEKANQLLTAIKTSPDAAETWLMENY